MTIFNPQLDTLASDKHLFYRKGNWYVENINVYKKRSCCSKIFTKRYDHKKVLNTFVKNVNYQNNPKAAANLKMLIKQTAEHNIVALQYNAVKRFFFGERVVDISPYQKKLNLAQSNVALQKLKELESRYDELKKIDDHLNKSTAFSLKNIKVIVQQAKELKKALVDLAELKIQVTKSDQKQVDEVCKKFDHLLENLNKAVEKVDGFIISECQKQFSIHEKNPKKMQSLIAYYQDWALVAENFNRNLNLIHFTKLMNLSSPMLIEELIKQCRHLDKKYKNAPIKEACQKAEEIFKEFQASLKNPEFTDAYLQKVEREFNTAVHNVVTLLASDCPSKASRKIQSSLDQYQLAHEAFQKHLLLIKSQYTYKTDSKSLKDCISNLANLNHTKVMLDKVIQSSHSATVVAFKDTIDVLRRKVDNTIAAEDKLEKKYTQEIIDNISKEADEIKLRAQKRAKEILDDSEDDRSAKIENLKKIYVLSLDDYLSKSLQKNPKCQSIVDHFNAKQKEITEMLGGTINPWKEIFEDYNDDDTIFDAIEADIGPISNPEILLSNLNKYIAEYNKKNFVPINKLEFTPEALASGSTKVLSDILDAMTLLYIGDYRTGNIYSIEAFSAYLESMKWYPLLKKSPAWNYFN